MQLVSLPVSPFAARVRIAIHAKSLDVEVVAPPPDWPRSASFLRLNPLGRIPVLVTDDGDAIQESSVILEYLDERFPDSRRLMPALPELRSAARLFVRICDLYLMPPMIALAQECSVEAARRHAADLLSGLDVLEQLLPEDRGYSVPDSLTLADCALAPVLFAARVTGGRLGLDLLEGRHGVQQYEARLKEDPSVAGVIGEMEAGLREMSQRRG